MEPLLLAFIVFSTQLLVIISVAAIAEALVRVTDPRLRLMYWRGVALACFALPFSAILGPQAFGSGVTFLVASAQGTESARIRAVLPTAATVVWPLLCAGALARLGWLCARGRAAPAAPAAQPGSSPHTRPRGPPIGRCSPG
jgi:hypothetical protein